MSRPSASAPFAIPGNALPFPFNQQRARERPRQEGETANHRAVAGGAVNVHSKVCLRKRRN